MILYPGAMSTVKALLAAGLIATALSACGAIAKPSHGRGQVQDPRLVAGHLQCLRAHHLPASDVGPAGIQIGTPPGGPTIEFLATPGLATGYQIQNRAAGAEAIGSALLYPNRASDSELGAIEDCLNQGVSEPTTTGS